MVTLEARFWLEAVLLFVLLFDGPATLAWWLWRGRSKPTDQHEC